MPRSITVAALSFLILPFLLAFGCGGEGDGSDPPNDEIHGERVAAGKTAPSVEEPDDQPVTIDPNKMEMLRSGSPAERLAAKYELLVERIQMERREGQFTIARSIDGGLRPIAGEHHELLAAGLIDTTLMVEFVRLAEIVLQRNILSQKDRTGAQAMEQIGRIRGLIPEHSRAEAPPGETPAESGTPPPAE